MTAAGGGVRLTKPLLEAMAAALRAALAGEGFDGGDFDGLDSNHFQRALQWVEQEQGKRATTTLSPHAVA